MQLIGLNKAALCLISLLLHTNSSGCLSVTVQSQLDAGWVCHWVWHWQRDWLWRHSLDTNMFWSKWVKNQICQEYWWGFCRGCLMSEINHVDWGYFYSSQWAPVVLNSLCVCGLHQLLSACKNALSARGKACCRTVLKKNPSIDFTLPKKLIRCVLPLCCGPSLFTAKARTFFKSFKMSIS